MFEYLKKLDKKYEDNALWQFIKFNMVGSSVSLLQLLLANILPIFFDSFNVKLPLFLRGIFSTSTLSNLSDKYVIDGVVTWGYVLPFFLSNFLANIYGFYMNMKTIFKGKANAKNITIYLITITILILFTTWIQGVINAALSNGPLSILSRTIAATVAGLIQVAILFPFEKYVLFKEK